MNITTFSTLAGTHSASGGGQRPSARARRFWQATLAWAAVLFTSLGVCQGQDLTVTVAPQSQTANRGDIVTFQGTIRNNGSVAQFLNGDSIASSLRGFPILPVPFDLYLDDQPFIKGAPVKLVPGQEWTGSLFRVTVGLDTPAATYDGSFSVLGGTGAAPFNALGSGTFQLTVLGAAPASVPAAPINLTATDNGSNIALAWTDQATNEEGFSVEQSTNGSPYAVIALVGADWAHYAAAPLLSGTTYRFRVRAFNSFNTLTYSAYSNVVTVTTPAGPLIGTGDGAAGAYYNDVGGVHQSGTPALTRVDSTINFDWGTGSPGPEIGADSFSVRWTGKIQAQFSQAYTFYTNSDDGVRLWVNGVQLVDNWTDHGPTENSGTITLVAGQLYTFQMDMYENTGGSVAQLSWQGPLTPKQIVPQTQLYSGVAPVAPMNLTAIGDQQQVRLAWTPIFYSGNPANLTYKVYRGTFPGGESPTPVATGLTSPNFTDTGLTNQQVYYYKVTSVILGGESAASSEVNAVPHPTFASYQRLYFTPAQQADPNVSGPNVAPPGGNGLLNLTAYAFNESPWDGVTGNLPVEGVANGCLAITYLRRKPVTDVSYTVEVSPALSNPANWQSGPTYTTEVSTTPIDADSEWVTVRDNVPITTSPPARFIRVKVQSPP